MQWFLHTFMCQHFLKNCLVLFCHSALQFRKEGIQKTKIILTIYQVTPFTYQYQQNIFPNDFFFKGNRNTWKHFLTKFTFQPQTQAVSLLQTSNHTGIQVVTSDCAANTSCCLMLNTNPVSKALVLPCVLYQQDSLPPSKRHLVIKKQSRA